MKISIITVAYNSGRTIADTLRSVAMQTYADIEHIIIDGASSDDTLQQVHLHGGHVTQVVSEPDRGIYDAMNKGLEIATGDWVGFLNADDMLAYPDALERLASVSQGADALYADLVYVDEHDTDRIVRHWLSGEYDVRQLKLGWMPPHPTFYLRRSSLGHLRFDTGYRIAADYDFMLRCLTCPGVQLSYLPEVLVRMRSGGASNRSFKALWRKSSEDLSVMRRNRVGGVMTLLSKNFRKLPQFLRR